MIDPSRLDGGEQRQRSGQHLGAGLAAASAVPGRRDNEKGEHHRHEDHAHDAGEPGDGEEVRVGDFNADIDTAVERRRPQADVLHQGGLADDRPWSERIGCRPAAERSMEPAGVGPPLTDAVERRRGLPGLVLKLRQTITIRAELHQLGVRMLRGGVRAGVRWCGRAQQMLAQALRDHPCLDRGQVSEALKPTGRQVLMIGPHQAPHQLGQILERLRP